MANVVFRFHDEPFAAIAAGIKTIESRLYDSKRQDIRLGETLNFVSRSSGELIMVKVVGLLRYETFENLFTHNDHAKFNAGSVRALLTEIREYYSIEEERRYGVLGIEFEVVGS